MKLYQDVSLREGVQIVAETGMDNAIMVRGEMGIGKSTMLQLLRKYFPKHRPCYIDCTTKEAGDLLMPRFTEINGMWVTQFVPNSEFGLQYGEPLILMWDEVTKAAPAVRVQATRCWQERQLGEFPLPEGSIQFATGNLLEEGVSDSIQAHQQNRLDQIFIRKPTPTEWIQGFAIDAKIHPSIIQAVNQFPQMLNSFKEHKNPTDNPYIFHPGQPRMAFVTPRSLAKSSPIMYANLAAGVKTHALMGMVGEQAAVDIMAIHKIYDELPQFEEVIKNPTKAKIPKSVGAQCLFIWSAVQKVDAKTMTPLTEYLMRLPLEQQALFATTGVNTASKAGTITGNKKFFEWANQHKWLYADQTT